MTESQPNVVSVPSARVRIIAVVLLAGVLPWLISAVTRLVFGNVPYVHQPFHELLELLGSCIAAGVATLLLLRTRDTTADTHLLWVVAALAAMGLVDAVHAVRGISPNSYLRHGATLIGGALFACVWLPVPRPLLRRRELFLVMVVVLAAAVSAGLWFWSERLPATWQSATGDYTPLVKVMNALGGLGFLVAALFFLRPYRRQPSAEDMVLASHTLLFATAALLFGFSHTWAADWWVWHGARLTAYGILLITAFHVLQAASEQRRRLSESLQAEQQRLRGLLDMMPGYVLLLSRDYRVPFANRYFEERFGKSEGRRCYEYLFQRDAPCENCETFKVFTTNKPHDWEWQGPDGRYYSIHDMPFADSEGTPLILELGVDISERKSADEALRRSQQRLALHVQQTPLAVIEWNLNFEVTDWNPRAEALFGYTREEALGRHASFIVPSATRAQVEEVWRKLLERKGGLRSSNLNVDKQGRTLTCEWYNTVLVDSAGKVIGVASLVEDISERRRAEERLREQAALLELTPAAILVRDLDRRVVYWSRGAEELYGYTSRQVLGKVTHAVLHTRFPRPLPEIENTVLNGTPWEGELVHTRRDGKEIAVASRWALQRDDAGQAVGLLEINVDISARKRAEEEAQRYMQELQRSNAELQDFASIASHDLQEPLRKVIAFGEDLKDHCGDRLDQQGRDYLARMQRAAERMSALIEALLAYSRVTTRAQAFAPVDLLQVWFEVLVDMEERIAQSHAQVVFGPLRKVMADRTQIRQLLQNLLANALKFQPPGVAPRVEVQACARSNGCCHPGSPEPAGVARSGVVEISVRDNGIGFDEKYLDRIFRPFQRLHGRSQYEGSGMGLAICRKVVARHGGTITAHSRPGQGSTFVVTLPEAPMMDERGTTWNTNTATEASRSESCLPKTMTTITS